MSVNNNLPAIARVTALVKIFDVLEKQLVLAISLEKDPILKAILESIRYLGNRIAGFLAGIKDVIKNSDNSKKSNFVTQFFIKYYSVISQNTHIAHKIIEYVLEDLEWLNQHSDRIINCLKSLYTDLFTLQVDCEEIYKHFYNSPLEFDFGFRIKMDIEPELYMTLDKSFEALGIDKRSTLEEMKTAFRYLVKQLHPDLNPDASREEFFKVEQAYKRLLSYYKVNN
jgi:hypothetical protein